MLNICFNRGECTLLKFGLPDEETTFSYENLDWGRIHPNDFDAAREELIYKSFSPCSEIEKLQMIQEVRERHKDIIKAAKNHQDLRIWCASNPASQCGLFYTVHSLKGIDCRIFIVNMPSDIGCLPPDHDRSWTETDPDDIEPCLRLQREISAPERQIYEQNWEMLANENAELRVNIRGRITSVAVDYFDNEILSYAPVDEDFKLGNLLGYALQCPRYLSPSFVEDRIEAMISQGRITLVKRSDDPDFNNATVLCVKSTLAPTISTT